MKAAILVVLSACSVFSPKPSETLAESVRSYNDGVRWGRFEVAAVHVPAKQRSQFVDESDARAKDLKITDYDVIRVAYRGDREAQVQVKLEWYKSSEGTIHETHAVQTWERNDKEWLLVDESRLRGSEMPGLPEPLAKD